MFEVALIELVSVGLWRFFGSGDGAGEPTAAALDDDALVRRLLVLEPKASGALINRCVADLWHAIRSVDLPDDIAIAHLERLPAIIAADTSAPGSPADGGAAFFTKSPTALADAIVLARQFDTIPDPLDETVLTYLLETFLKTFHACRAEIAVLMPYLASRTAPAEPAAGPLAIEIPRIPAPPALPSAPPAPAAARTLEKIARADALGITVPLLELITVALINQTRSPDLLSADLTAAAAEARAIRDELENLATEPGHGHPDVANLVGAFDSARFEACNRTLTALEEEAVHRAGARSPRVAHEAQRAIAMRVLRARLHALSGNHVQAARQLGNAQRHVARNEPARRWPLAAREARHYERAALMTRNHEHLEKAANACSSALAALTTDAPPALRLEIQSELAHYLIRLAEIEQSSTRFEIALMMLSDTLQHLDAAAHPHERFLALVRQGDAYMGLARQTGTASFYDQAVAALEEASELLTESGGAEAASAPPQRPFDRDVSALRARLAIALLGAPATAANEALHDSALETLIGVLPELGAPRELASEAGYMPGLLTGVGHQLLAQWLAGIGQAEQARDHHRKAVSALNDWGFARLSQTFADNVSTAAQPAGTSPAHPATAA